LCRFFENGKKIAVGLVSDNFVLTNRYGCLSFVEVHMSQPKWMTVGRGRAKADLEKVIQLLKEKWLERYEYRVDEDRKTSHEQPYRLMIKHV